MFCFFKITNLFVFIYKIYLIFDIIIILQLNNKISFGNNFG